MQTRPEPTPTHCLCYLALGLWANIPFLPHPTLITPGSGTRQPRTAFTAQSLPKLFTLLDPKSVYPASPTPFLRNHNKGSCLCFLHTPSASGLTDPQLDLPCTAPCDMVWWLLSSITLAGPQCPGTWANTVLDRTLTNTHGMPPFLGNRKWQSVSPMAIISSMDLNIPRKQ